MEKCILYIITGFGMVITPGCYAHHGVITPHRVVYTSHIPADVHIYERPRRKYYRYHKPRRYYRPRRIIRKRTIYRAKTTIHRHHHHYYNRNKNNRNRNKKKWKKKKKY